MAKEKIKIEADTEDEVLAFTESELASTEDEVLESTESELASTEDDENDLRVELCKEIAKQMQ